MHRRWYGLDEAGLREPLHRGRWLRGSSGRTREPASASPALLDLQQHFEAVELLTKLPRVTEKIAHGAPIAHRLTRPLVRSFPAVRLRSRSGGGRQASARRPGPDLRPTRGHASASTRDGDEQERTALLGPGHLVEVPTAAVRRPPPRPAVAHASRSACRTAPCSGAGGAGAKRPARCGSWQWSSRADRIHEKPAHAPPGAPLGFDVARRRGRA